MTKEKPHMDEVLKMGKLRTSVENFMTNNIVFVRSRRNKVYELKDWVWSLQGLNDRVKLRKLKIVISLLIYIQLEREKKVEFWKKQRERVRESEVGTHPPPISTPSVLPKPNPSMIYLCQSNPNPITLLAPKRRETQTYPICFPLHFIISLSLSLPNSQQHHHQERRETKSTTKASLKDGL